MVNIMFETFNAPAVHIVNKATTAMYGCGRTTGTVINIGHHVTHITPIYEGCLLAHSMMKLGFGGLDLTCYLAKLMNERGCSYTPSSYDDREILTVIKEKLCYVDIDEINMDKTFSDID